MLKLTSTTTTAITLLLFSALGRAGPLLTEIHYNGPASGADPDEFLELSNVGSQTINLSGWSFSEGINFVFDAGVMLAPNSSLVIARAPADFLGAFPEFDKPLFDFAGALSNGGETLALSDAGGDVLWSIRYDDAPPWPTEADGLGASLQLIAGRDPAIAESWTAADPTPGIWLKQASPKVELPAPHSLLLIASGLLFVRLSNAGMRCRTAVRSAAAAKHYPPQGRL